LSRVFRHRGIVEGFYGQPWAHVDRLWWIERLAELDMNTFVVAPKDDPLQRERWREPYPEPELAHFRELIALGHARGVTVGFALSPGLSICYGDASERAALLEKLQAVTRLGSSFVALCLDDVPTELAHAEDRAAFTSLAAAHASLARAVRESVGSEVTLWLVPTDYAGNEASPYGREVAALLPAEIEVAWTGRTIVPPTVAAEEARARAGLMRRKLLLWDNVPVNDGPMRTLLHLGPYVGREAGLADSLSGVLLNPMPHARASYVTVACAAAWLRDPRRYDPEAAWRLALRALGAGAEDAFETFALAHRFSALTPGDRDPALESAWHASRRGRSVCATDELLALLEARIAAGDALRAGLDDRRLLAELEPWLAGHERESRRMRAALELLATLAGPASSLEKCLAWVRFEGRLTRDAPAPTTSYGPRRAFYPQLVGLSQGSARFASDPALFRERCLADEIVAFAEDAARAALGPER